MKDRQRVRYYTMKLAKAKDEAERMEYSRLLNTAQEMINDRLRKRAEREMIKRIHGLWIAHSAVYKQAVGIFDPLLQALYLDEMKRIREQAHTLQTEAMIQGFTIPPLEDSDGKLC